MFKQLLTIGGAACLVASASANAHEVAPSRYLETAKPYAPYEFLIGDWYSKIPGQPMTIHQRFSWGPDRAYITYSAYLVMPGKPEQLHFEGMMVFDGKAKALDFLFALQPPSGAEEKGTVSVQPDGSVLREVEMTDSGGKGERYRQTFRKGDGGTVITSMAEQTAKGWEVQPPGDLVMERQAATADASR
jgi:hypothetical protein